MLALMSTYFVLGHVDWKTYLWKINKFNYSLISVEWLNTPEFTTPGKFMQFNNDTLFFSAFEFVTYQKKNSHELLKEPNNVFDIALYRTKNNSKFKSYKIGKYDKNQAVGFGLVVHNGPNSYSLISYRIKPKRKLKDNH